MSFRRRAGMIVGAITLGLGLGAASVWAQEEKKDEGAKEEVADSPKVKVERGAGGKKVYVI